MNIYDKAHEFAKDLKNAKEVSEYKDWHEKIEKNKENKELVNKFRDIQIEAYNEQMEKGDISQNTKDKMQNLSKDLSLNIEVSNYIQAEAKFAMLWEDIIKILHDGMELDLTFKNDNQ